MVVLLYLTVLLGFINNSVTVEGANSSYTLGGGIFLTDSSTVDPHLSGSQLSGILGYPDRGATIAF